MHRTKITVWIIAALLMMPLSLSASRVDLKAAQTVAQRFMGEQQQRSLNATSQVPSMTMAHAEVSAFNPVMADYYVFNAEDGSAFVIVSGDDRAEQVLGYGEGAIDMSNIPCNMRWLLDMYKEQIEYLHSHPAMEVENFSQSLKDANLRYLPLLTCDWSQGTPYNDQCPLYEGEHCVTGCVATAMAQVMYYWRYPKSSPPVHAYKLLWMDIPALPATTFDWDEMLDTYTGPYTASQGEAVAKLMRYCGQACCMDYGVDGSGAFVSEQLAGMKLLGYNSDAFMADRKNYNTATWNSMMLRELADGYPILYSGSGQAGGHAFVLDGYDGNQGKYHINWGWASRGNGYFALGAFNVIDYMFNSQQQMLCRIYPASVPEPATRYDFKEHGIYYKQGTDPGEVAVTCGDTRYNSYSGEITIPSTITHDGKTMTVTAIGDDAFRDCFGLSKVTLPSSIRHIGAHAFRSSSSLTQVVIPEGLESIGNQAFTNCVALQQVYLPSSVREIGYKAFLNCTGLNRVDIDEVQSWIDIHLDGYYSSPLLYAHRLFVGGNEIKHLIIPETNTKLPDYKFAGFSGMTSLVLPSNLEEIGNSTFAGCSSLTALELPESLTTLGTASFKDCTGLRQVVLVGSVQRVKGETFAGCSGLEEVVFDGPVARIEADAFAGCESLSRVVVPDIKSWFGNGFMNEKSSPLYFAQHLLVNDNEVTSLEIPNDVSEIGDYMFGGFKSLNALVMGDHVKKIGKNAFAQCKGLSRIQIGDGVVEIGEKAFSTCSNLQSLTIGSSVQSIGDRAFYACTGLTEITCKALVPPPAAYFMWFSNSTCSNARLMVPIEAVDAYKSAAEWKRFTLIVGVDMHEKVGDVNGDGEINIADINTIINVVVEETSSIAACDVNGDGEVNIADVNAVIDLILK